MELYGLNRSAADSDSGSSSTSGSSETFGMAGSGGTVTAPDRVRRKGTREEGRIIMVVFPSFAGLTAHGVLIGRTGANKRRRAGQADPAAAKSVRSLPVVRIGETA